MKHAIFFSVEFHSCMFSNPSRGYVPNLYLCPDWLWNLVGQQGDHLFC